MSLLTTSKKGKWVIGGALTFAIIATATSGLASWVFTNNAASGSVDGNVKVATISDEFIEIKNVQISSGNIVFGPSAGDKTGIVQSGGTDDEESLSITVTGTVNAGATASWTGLTGTFSLDSSASSSAYDSAISNNYIVAPQAQTFSKPSGFSETATFTMTFSFAWGTAFGSENPSLYFDDDTAGTITKDYATAKSVLTELQELNNLKYLVTISVA